MSLIKINAPLLFLFFLLVGCVAPNYDAVSEQQISSIQNEIDLKLSSWTEVIDREQKPLSEIKEIQYANNIDFYNKVQADLRSLEIRLSLNKNPQIRQQLITFSQSLSKQLTTFQNDHKQRGYLFRPQIENQRKLFNVQMKSLLATQQQFKS
ncbi:hypothetical protein ACQ3G7_03075 [Kosakonia oryzendophytica]|uniref:hypothetical protein n=1 Tax=Kosakonia oryzendophytica TaxID=1005665 RepID=UPI003D33377E